MSSNKQIRITKIKFQEGGTKTRIEYQRWRKGDEWDDYMMQSLNTPVDDFVKTMNDLAKHVCVICELPEKYSENMTVTGLSFSYTNGIIGCVITSQKKLKASNSPLILNTPHMTETGYSDGQEGNLLPFASVNLLYDAMEYARAYIRGESKQLQLKLEV